MTVSNPRTLGRCHLLAVASLLLTAGALLVWFLVARHATVGAGPPIRDPLDGPSVFVLCTCVVATTYIVLVSILWRRHPSAANILSACAIVGASGLITIALSLLVAFATPPLAPAGTIRWEPSLVADRTAFAKARALAYGCTINHFGTGDYVVRKSWRLDEYGVRPDTETAQSAGAHWLLPWEEYGIPFRCLSSRYHFGWPRPNRTTLSEWFPIVLRNLGIAPLPFMYNTALFSSFALLAINGCRLVNWWRRASAGECVGCGHQLLLDQVVCPDCGRPVAPIDRCMVRSMRPTKDPRS